MVCGRAGSGRSWRRPGAASRKYSDSAYCSLTVAAHPREVLRDELRQEVLQLRRLALRPVGQVVVLHRLGAADVVNPDDQRLQVLVLLDRPEVEHEQADGDERHAQQRDLEVRVHHQRRAEQLDVLALRVLERWQADSGGARVVHGTPPLHHQPSR